MTLSFMTLPVIKVCSSSARSFLVQLTPSVTSVSKHHPPIVSVYSKNYSYAKTAVQKVCLNQPRLDSFDIHNMYTYTIGAHTYARVEGSTNPFSTIEPHHPPLVGRGRQWNTQHKRNQTCSLSASQDYI